MWAPHLFLGRFPHIPVVPFAGNQTLLGILELFQIHIAVNSLEIQRKTFEAKSFGDYLRQKNSQRHAVEWEDPRKRMLQAWRKKSLSRSWDCVQPWKVNSTMSSWKPKRRPMRVERAVSRVPEKGDKDREGCQPAGTRV